MSKHTLTLEFDNLADLAAAVARLQPVLGAPTPPTSVLETNGQVAAALKAQPAKKPVATVSKPAEPASGTPPVSDSSAEPAAETPVFEYKRLQQAVFAVVNNGQEAAIAGLVAKYGVKRFNELPPNKWSDAHADVLAVAKEKNIKLPEAAL